MGKLLHHLLSQSYFQLLILDLVFTIFVIRGIGRKHFPAWAAAVPTLALFLSYFIWRLLW